ncbi:MAG TPA: NAD(P)-dependent alcohol dehydrogenase [Cyclobacteriaceae bacterium]|nr:NAD(P)-dependent alcohol dehydrogenase [Cyclobacteriaceae bacterium]
MKAILCTKYGSPEVLQLVEIDKPAPKPNEILAKIKVSTVTFGDCELRNLSLPPWTKFPLRLIFGYNKPRRLIPGMEFAGVIEAVGSEVSGFKPGDAVFGSTGMAMGGNAEYVCRPVKALGTKPDNVSFEDVATIPVGGINALHFLRMANIQPGQKVLVIGAGGSIGTWGVILAKYYGAEVTAVDHTNKLSMLREIGADHVIDYTQEDFSTNGIRYDVIFDIVYKSSFSKCVGALTDTGCYLMANSGPRRMIKALFVEMRTNKKIRFAFAGETQRDLNHLAGLIASKKVKPVIDRHYPLEQTREAHRYVEQSLKKGAVIIGIS